MKHKFTRRDFLKAASIGTTSAIALACGLIESRFNIQLTFSNLTQVRAKPMSSSSAQKMLQVGFET